MNVFTTNSLSMWLQMIMYSKSKHFVTITQSFGNLRPVKCMALIDRYSAFTAGVQAHIEPYRLCACDLCNMKKLNESDSFGNKNRSSVQCTSCVSVQTIVRITISASTVLPVYFLFLLFLLLLPEISGGKVVHKGTQLLHSFCSHSYLLVFHIFHTNLWLTHSLSYIVMD